MPRICITIADKTPQPYRFPIETEVVSIGRSGENNVVIDHPSVSSKHCEMKRVQGGFVLVDLGSTNGIHLDGTEWEVIDLKDGMDAKVGDVLFNYQLTDEEKGSLSGEKFKKRQRKKRAERVKEVPKQAPKRIPSPPPVSGVTALGSSNDNGARDFAIFLLFIILAGAAFYLGMNSAHKSETRSEETPYGRSLLKDIQNK